MFFLFETLYNSWCYSEKKDVMCYAVVGVSSDGNRCHLGHQQKIREDVGVLQGFPASCDPLHTKQCLFPTTGHRLSISGEQFNGRMIFPCQIVSLN